MDNDIHNNLSNNKTNEDDLEKANVYAQTLLLITVQFNTEEG